LAPGQGLEP